MPLPPPFESPARFHATRRRLAPLLAALCASGLANCRSTASDPGSAKSAREANVEQIRELISQGALRPVEALPPGDPAASSTTRMDDGAFERAESEAIELVQQSGEPIVPPPESNAPPSDAAAVQPAATLDPASSPESAPPTAATDFAPPVQVLVPEPFTENPYLVFGKRIQVYPESGLIMKPFPLRVGTGTRLENLLRTYGNFSLWESGPQRPDQVRIQMIEKWDQELFTNLREVVPDDGKTVNVADWLVVVAGAELLKEVESFINIFAAGVPQIEIEAKIVEVTLNESLDLGIRPVDLNTPIFGFPDHTFFKSVTYALPNGMGASPNTLVQLGGVLDGMAFNAVLEALAGFENVSIISRPKIAVREGGKAEIVNTLKIPTYAISGITADGKFGATLNYEEVGIKLFVVPRVVGTQTVALNIDVEASSQSGTSVTFAVADGPTLSNPIISKRAAKTVVYLEPGQAVILGGLITERLVDIENSVPVLGRIPILGYLFKSKRTRKEQTNVLFFIRPRILQGSDLNREF